MEKIKKLPWRLLIALLAVHFLVSLVFILVSSTSHPLLGMLKTVPLAIQIIAVMIFTVVIYIIPGYLFIISQQSHDETIAYVDALMFVLSVIILISFIVSFIYAKFYHTKQGWLIYATTNPGAGLFIYNVFNTSATWWDLFWLFTAFAPAGGLMIGMYLRLKGEGAVK